jgi:uncharacterized protein YmfQ (DUF2313 family)
VVLARALTDGLNEARALVPTGDAWTRDPRSTWDKLLAGMSSWRGRVEVRADDVLRESDPRSTSELLPEWEEAVGLPDECLPVPASIAERRALVASRLVGEGGGSRRFFVELARAVGYIVTIEESVSDPVRCGTARCGDSLGGELLDFVWKVRAPLALVREARCGSARCGDPLRSFGTELLECVINRAAPAHTLPLFIYDGLCYLTILDETGEPVQVQLAGDNLLVRDEFGNTVLVPIPAGELIVYDEAGNAVRITVTCDEE